jgi:hypothetical protein
MIANWRTGVVAEGGCGTGGGGFGGRRGRG